MPTYDYACTECDHRFEIVQAFTDDSLTECPVCGGKLRKVFGAVGVVFKGSGFYRTDSRASSNGSHTTTKKGSDAGAAPKDGEKVAASASSNGSKESTGSHGSSESSSSSSGSSSTTSSTSGSSGSSSSSAKGSAA